jgi:hypothetical protein
MEAIEAIDEDNLASACERNTPTAPSAGALVTFAVANEISRVSFAL